ncbi:hypothetical protein GIB67_038060 [Kingdonia uniflora]|uniref:KIB1-4 beta-propeller domain-containing protein n=1 Tax=Kingdonia uniflora TaxID=39325 RepID=A0A7J7N9C9_9MAGN|nr:hypothetical protein GIB67_033442 [Kingdonia uniflora]KAF6163746.1 hypothetical protein GIB67_038060 [Kingdonia uniflora]
MSKKPVILMADWSQLPGAPICIVAKRLLAHDLSDFLSFRGVCRNWRSVTIERHLYSGIPRSPWMMLAEQQGSDMRRFYSLSTEKSYNFDLPEADRRRCWGSPHGWLITFGLDLQIYLLNPLSLRVIWLPPQWTFQGEKGKWIPPEHLLVFFIGKAILSSSPTEGDNYMVMVIYSHNFRLAVVKPGDVKWTTVKGPCGPYKDIIWFENHFYAIDNDGVLRVCDVNCDIPKVVDFAYPPDDLDFDMLYLVEISGHLHMVSRLYFRYEDDEQHHHNERDHDTVRFDLYKLDISTRKWETLCGSGDYSLFVGNNSSFSLLASDYPKLKENCVYFTDDYADAYGAGELCSTGIFSFENDEVEFIDLGHDMRSVFSRPLWITPNPW